MGTPVLESRDVTNPALCLFTALASRIKTPPHQASGLVCLCWRDIANVDRCAKVLGRLGFCASCLI